MQDGVGLKRLKIYSVVQNLPMGEKYRVSTTAKFIIRVYSHKFTFNKICVAICSAIKLYN